MKMNNSHLPVCNFVLLILVCGGENCFCICQKNRPLLWNWCHLRSDLYIRIGSLLEVTSILESIS